jgi:hypothetical protein
VEANMAPEAGQSHLPHLVDLMEDHIQGLNSKLHKATAGARKAGEDALKGPENDRRAIDKDFTALEKSQPELIAAYYANEYRSTANLARALVKGNRNQKDCENHLGRYRKR